MCHLKTILSIETSRYVKSRTAKGQLRHVCMYVCAFITNNMYRSKTRVILAMNGLKRDQFHFLWQLRNERGKLYLPVADPLETGSALAVAPTWSPPSTGLICFSRATCDGNKTAFLARKLVGDGGGLISIFFIFSGRTFASSVLLARLIDESVAFRRAG